MYNKVVLIKGHMISRLPRSHKFIGGALYNQQKRFTHQIQRKQVQHHKVAVEPRDKRVLSLKL